jgi:2-polyprenyl-6-methoxyphenol hydroxylase-like FAD-dependent oxidoreductase
LEQYASPGGPAIIIGDAAHAITPLGGQGAVMAFEDAETLAYTMARLDFVQNRSKLLKTWTTHRQKRVEKVRGFTRANASLRDPGHGYIRQSLKE